MFSRNSNYENKKKQFKQAFTLIELGLVIIIIALLITAIITGQKIIERARLTSFITEIKEIASAFSSFNIAFGALPGDFDEANDYFPNTISGDGNNDIDSSTESDQVFYHLSEAKMLQDNYENGDLYNFTIKNSFGYVSYADGIEYSQGEDHLYRSGNFLNIGDGTTASDAYISTILAYQIDKKIDDGLPRKGFMIVASDSNASLISGNINNDCIGTQCLMSASGCDDDPYLISNNDNISCNSAIEIEELY